MQKIYAGIGSRETPDETLIFMTSLATQLDKMGFILRSGGASGADEAFARGGIHSEIYLPWSGFRNNTNYRFTSPSEDAFPMAANLHPAWDKLSQGAQKLMARNCHQVLGYDLQTPCAFVVCWTKDGAETREQCSSKTGGTGQAIRLASDHNIPVFNLKYKHAVLRLTNYVKLNFPESFL